jgi:hypothetical protein
MRFLTLGFFHQSITLRSLIKGLNHFCIWLKFTQKFRNISDSALCIIARSRKENFWLECHTELHSAESQIKLF